MTATGSGPAGAYRLTDLGWAQFERLCAELLELRAGVGADRWQGRADRRRIVTVAEGLELVSGRPAAGPALVAVWWLRAVVQARAAAGDEPEAPGWLAEELTAPPRPECVVLLTNAELDAAAAARLAERVEQLAGRPVELQLVGPAELGALLDREPLLRRRLPSVLGVREPGLVPPDVLARSSGDVGAARELARVFVPTRAYANALRVLERHRFAVLTGPPEMGKTAIARMVALALSTEGWEVHECVRPEELWSRLARDRPQVFVADDAFGSTEYRPEAAERWALDLDRVLRAMDERHWLVWTSRPAPLRAALARIHREHGVERWPQPAEVQVAAAELDVEEKALILYRHARAAEPGELPSRLVRRYGWEIVSHRHFTPERIRRFVADRLPRLAEEAGELGPDGLARAVAAEIREPTEAMATSLRALPPEHRALLVAMLDAPPGPVAERDLAAAARRHGDGGLPRPPAELVDRLTDHFLRVVPPTSVTWVHPSWRDLVIEEIAADGTRRRDFLARCSVDGVLLALSVGGGAAGARVLPLLVDDADWDVLAGRIHELADELDTTGLARLLLSLQAALEANVAERVRTELEAVAGELLELLRRRWDASCEPIPVALLEAFVVARAALRAPPPPLPDVHATWIELVPRAPIDIAAADELGRLDDWLRLGRLLEFASVELARELGFPEEQIELLRQLVRDARELADRPGRPAPAPLLVQCLRRLSETVPVLAWETHRIAGALERSDAPERAVGWPRAAAIRPTAASSAIVTRILRDLER